MEWSEDGQFEDHASLTFINRNLPVPAFTKEEIKGWLYIRTEFLTLSYHLKSGKFKEDNLIIEFQWGDKTNRWHPGLENKGNLMGTARTLDGYDGNYSDSKKSYLELDPGIISTEGWVMIDDTKRPLFDNSEWPWVMARPARTCQDFYFFGYGRDYKSALYDFTQIAGKIPMPPKFAFGVWWSRYWAYSDQEFKELVNEYKIHTMPLDVLVIDMDWHIVDKKEWFKNGEKQSDQAGEWAGWTGFTWNPKYFPDPTTFLKWTDEHKLRTCLNLHPASGIQPHEKVYSEFARAMGIDPATKKYVPFDIVDKNFTNTFLKLVIHPMEEQGMDFWWLDWQQWSTTKIEGVNPTFYLNYVFFSDMQRQNKVRPLLYHRWGGLGNHRYQIGFSGDTRITWRSLAFQPYFTYTASNVCYGYWSHDIGGHYKGPENDFRKDPELFTRWVQWGAFSPIFRTHCTKDPLIERRLWAWPLDYYYSMRKAVKLRYSLFPYIYSASHEAYETGISILRPMYYNNPENENAYAFKGQYLFGNDILVSPITKPMNKYADGRDSLYTIKVTWLPSGNWIEWNSGTLVNGNQIVAETYMMSDIPLYIKEGAIIPMQPEAERITDNAIDPLILNIFPGRSGKTSIYDDAGNDQNYIKGEFTETKVDFSRDGNEMKITVYPVKGSFSNMIMNRAYEIRLPVSYPPSYVEVNGGGINYSSQITPDSWTYDGNMLTTVIRTGSFSVNKEVNIRIVFPDMDITLLSGKSRKISRMLDVVKLVNNLQWPYDHIFLLEDIVDIAQTGIKISQKPDPSYVVQEITAMDHAIPELIGVLEKINDQRYVQVYDLLKTIGNK
jgi:hypothetical protein